MKDKKLVLLQLSSIFCFLIFALSFMLMSIGSQTVSDKLSTTSLIAAILFWASILAGLVIQIILTKLVKNWLAANKVDNESLPKRIGIISFFKNKLAAIFDILMFGGLIGLVAAFIATQGIGFLCYVFLSLFVFSFAMHCILNGKKYFVISNRENLSKANRKG